MAVAKSSSWRMEDLQDLEQYGLAAELESTNLEGPAEAAGAGGQRERDFGAYNMTEVLSNLLTEDQLLDESFSFSPLGFPSNGESPASLLSENKSEVSNQQNDPLSIVLNVPSAFGIKTTQDKVTYINKGHTYEVKLQVNVVMANQISQDTVYKGVMTLGFCEIRLKNSEQEQFELWTKDHPQERLLEVDAMSCDGLSDVQNSDQLLNVVSFVWSPLRPATLAFKVNCLSTEFAARKHGGEKGALLRLEMDTFCVDPSNSSSPPQHFHRCSCNIKVFKDKGADRKQRQDQLKMEKLQQNDLANFHLSEAVTRFLQLAIPIPNIVLASPSPSTPSTRGIPSGASPYCLTTSPSAATCASQQTVATQNADITTTSSIDQTREWLLQNRFSQYLSLFVNYSGLDLLRLSRRDLVDLCGTADGIRLYNALRTQTVRVLYVTIGQEKVFQALCLEQLTARELLTRLAEKLSLSLDSVSTLVRLTSTGILVLIDDTVVQNMRDEEGFMVQMIKEESGRYQIILRDHPYTTHEGISMQGATTRH